MAAMFILDQVVPWGRSFDEYRRMFALSDADFGGSILGCADGPASFNAEATAQGLRVHSVDPLYRWSAAEIRDRIRATSEQVLAQTRQNADQFIWDEIPSLEELRTRRLAAMELILADYETGRLEGRYIDGTLPVLPFTADAFDLAVCSHFLFLYSTQLTLVFHVNAIVELCRVAREVRVFPLLSLASRRSPHVEPVLADLQNRGYTAVIEEVPYEFQRGGNQMMRLRRPAN